MPDNDQGASWIRQRLSRPTRPGLSVGDFVTRLGTFIYKPGDRPIRNIGRGARAIALGLLTGPGGLAAAAARNAAQGEVREGATHLARTAWDRMTGDGGAPTPSQGPSRGYTWPTDTGPPAPETYTWPVDTGPPREQSMSSRMTLPVPSRPVQRGVNRGNRTIAEDDAAVEFARSMAPRGLGARSVGWDELMNRQRQD